MNELFLLDNAKISFGSKEIIHGVSFAVNAGELSGLLGLNGSGKTTILHGACGFIPMAGNLYAAGQSCKGLNERKRAKLISFIPQICSLWGGKTAFEAVMMGFNSQLGILESPSKKQREAALDTMEKLGCAHFAEQDFDKLSQGQRQMVILARCIVQDAPVMLMDEPDSALDFSNKHIVLEKIRNIIQAEKKAGVITLHDPNFAMAYCDRLILLKAGVKTAELDMRTASSEEIREKLSLIYGDIKLYSNGAGYLLGRAS